MRLATGHPPTNSKAGPPRAFTMVELVIVMTIMVIAVGVAAPSFKAFLQGSNLENEARRFLSLTRFGAGRAVAEGLPVDLGINVKQNKYWLAAVGGYTETKTNVSWFMADNNVQMLVSQSFGALTQSNFWTPSVMRGASLPIIRFQPDGFVSETSPQIIKFRQASGPEIWIVQNPNHLRYDLQLDHARSSR
ncbi:MAG: prepilin-type N-terminal cleavage/methylation domain-containing protein [Verrucomicrobiota bacterium]